MKFKYKSFPITTPSVAFPDRKAILRPIIPVELFHNNKNVRTLALIDSGADFCIFNREIEELLGLDKEGGNCESFGGITGEKALAFFHKLQISVGGIKFDTYCGFSDGINKFGHGILGQRGFFDLYKVAFNHQKGEIEIKGN